MNEISTAVAGDNRKVTALVSNSVAKNTHRAYGTSLARIDAWADGHPLDDRSIAAYFAALHDIGRAPATISLVAAALRFRASLANEPDPVGPIARRTLSGIRRMGRERGRGQAVALKWAKADAAATLAQAEATPKHRQEFPIHRVRRIAPRPSRQACQCLQPLDRLHRPEPQRKPQHRPGRHSGYESGMHKPRPQAHLRRLRTVFDLENEPPVGEPQPRQARAGVCKQRRELRRFRPPLAIQRRRPGPER